MNELNQSAKVFHVKNEQGKSQEVSSRLKKTWLGGFYVRHLKRYPLIRRLANWIWRKGYLVYFIHFAGNKNEKRWRKLTKLSEFVKKNEISIVQIVEGALVETPVPKVFPVCDKATLVAPHDHYHFPPIYVAKIGGGAVYGGTNLVLVEDDVICHDLYDFDRDYTSEELHWRALIDTSAKRIRFLLHDETPIHLPAAAPFVDACATNYAHWLTEVLPRIAAFGAEEQFNGIPIVVNDGLHKNIMESLTLVVGPERKIITLPIGRALQVDELYLTSVAGYVPFSRRNNKLGGHSHGMFSPNAFELVRKRISSIAGKQPKQVWPEKIYLRRNSGVRKVTNAAELEYVLIAKGYAIVEPERLTFLQQAQVFMNAKVIVGSSGAALANVLFAPEDTKIFVLISRHPHTSYWYWQNIACATRKRISYIFGEKTANRGGIHADYKVELDFFLNL